MAQSRHPTDQFRSSHYLVCAGTILFESTRAPLRVCLLHHTVRDEWLLPKGRKDLAENVHATALRETFEETGYPCAALPLDLVTRAPEPGAQTKDAPARVGACEDEPFMLTLRRTTFEDVESEVRPNGHAHGGASPSVSASAGVKLVWWFAAVRTPGTDKVDGTQTAVESFESRFFDADEALRVATFQTDREVIAAAVELVRATYPEARDEVESASEQQAQQQSQPQQSMPS
jgi:8-oxo-dGTP pyrophosphatase MutT (NUDIX family)